MFTESWSRDQLLQKAYSKRQNISSLGDAFDHYIGLSNGNLNRHVFTFYYFFSYLYLNKIKVYSFSWCNLTGQKITRNKKKTAQYYFVVDVCLCLQTMVFVISKPESRGDLGPIFSRRCRRCHSCCLFSIKSPSRKKVSWSKLQKPWINFYIREGEHSFWLFLTVCQKWLTSL